MSSTICKGLTLKGQPCKNRVSSTEEYCFRHKGKDEVKNEEVKKQEIKPKRVKINLNKCKHQTKNRKPCTYNEIIKDCGYCSRHKPPAHQLCICEDEKNNKCPFMAELPITYCKFHMHVYKEMVPCCARSYSGLPCTNISHPKSRDKHFCTEHKYQWRFSCDDCSICLANVETYSPTKLDGEIPLHCGHWFHKDCIKQWNKPTCPTCRSFMYPFEIKYFELNADEAINDAIKEWEHFFTTLTEFLKSNLVNSGNKIEFMMGLNFSMEDVGYRNIILQNAFLPAVLKTDDAHSQWCSLNYHDYYSDEEY
jgi:hypothetical protein